jgi:hypothetical protein
MTAHARLGPSGADRWMICSPSVRLIEKLRAAGLIPTRSSSGAADEGTAAHQVRGDALELGMDAWDFVGSSLTINGVTYECTEEMAAHLQPGMDWINEQPGELIVEHCVDLGRWMPGQFGTLDTAIIDRKGDRLIVNDLKYGAGVPVDAVGNRQLRIYAIGIMDNFDLWGEIDNIDIIIDQPRAGGMKPWSVTAIELESFAHEVQAAAKRVDDPDAPFVPTAKGCHFCEAKDHCDAYTAWMLDLAGLDDLDDLDSEPTLPDPTEITPERRWYVVSHAHLVTKWLAKLHSDSMAAAEAGQPDPGSKLVPGQRGNRRYTNETRAERILKISLGEDAYTRKVKSPAQAEKDLAPGRKKVGNEKAWRLLNRLVTQDEGRPILVPASDPREAIPSLTTGLDDLDDL